MEAADIAAVVAGGRRAMWWLKTRPGCHAPCHTAPGMPAASHDCRWARCRYCCVQEQLQWRKGAEVDTGGVEEAPACSRLPAVYHSWAASPCDPFPCSHV